MKNKIFLFFVFLVLISYPIDALNSGGGGGSCYCNPQGTVIENNCINNYAAMCQSIAYGSWYFGTGTVWGCECIPIGGSCPSGSPGDICCPQIEPGIYGPAPEGTLCSSNLYYLCGEECGSSIARHLTPVYCNGAGGCSITEPTIITYITPCNSNEICEGTGTSSISCIESELCESQVTCGIPSGNSKLIFKDITGTEVAFIDNQGYMSVNSIEEGASMSSIPAGSFIIKNILGNSVSYLDSNGNLKLSGQIYSNQGTLSPTTSGNLIIKNILGNIVAYFDSNGNLYLKNCYATGSDDIDEDGYTTGSGDCFDMNSEVNPGQTNYFTTPYSTISTNYWDYNCNNNIEKEANTFDLTTTYINTDCSILTQTQCENEYYFEGDISNEICGNPAIIQECGVWENNCSSFINSALISCR